MLQNIDLRHLDNAQLANLCGAMDENIKQIANHYDVTIQRRDVNFAIRGAMAQLAGHAIGKVSNNCARS